MRMTRRLEELLQEVGKGGSETSLEPVPVQGFLREYHEAAGDGRKALGRLASGETHQRAHVSAHHSSTGDALCMNGS